jgi:hypothetical protein
MDRSILQSGELLTCYDNTIVTRLPFTNLLNCGIGFDVKATEHVLLQLHLQQTPSA